MRPIPEHFTQQQRRFIELVASSRKNLVLKATAGSGKTTTVCEAAWHLDPALNTGYFVYNKHNTEDVQPRLPGHVTVQTAHAAGWRLLRPRYDVLELDDQAGLKLVNRLCERVGGVEDSAFYRRVWARVWAAARERLWVPVSEAVSLDRAQVRELLYQADAPPEMLNEPDIVNTLNWMLRSLQAESDRAFATREKPDFTDLLWWPYRHGLNLGQYHVVILDEAQDFTPLRQAFLLGLIAGERPGRFLAVGDAEQSIYQYSAADPQLFMSLGERPNTQVLPLSVSFRCPTSHVEQARAVSTFIESPPGMKAGTVEHVEAASAQYGRGDTVLCRKNAPLLALALRLLQQGVSVDVRGLNIEKRLLEYGSFLSRPFTAASLPGVLERHWVKVSAPLKSLKAQGDQDAEKRLEELRDLHACLSLLASQVLEGQEQATLGRIQSYLKRLYDGGADVLLSSVHKAKGLEWPQVTVLYPEMMPLPYGNEDEERCVAFVGLTRATETLRLAYGESAWEAGWRWGHPREGEREDLWLLERLRPEAGELPSLEVASSEVASPEAYSPQARVAAARERLREQAQQLRAWQAQQTQGEMPAALAQLLAAREQQQATQEAVRGEQTAGERPLPELVKEVMQELKVKAMSQKAAQDVGAKAAPANLVLPVPSAQDDFLRQLFGDAAVQVEGEQVRGEVQRIPLFPAQAQEGLTALEASRRRLAQRQREIMATKLIRLRAFAHLEDGDHTVPYGALRQVLENIRYGLWLERARWAAMVLRELRSRPEGAGVYLSARAFAYLERLSEAFVEHRALAYGGAEGHELVGVMGRSGLEVQRAALVSETDREIVVELEGGQRLRFTPWLDAWGDQETFLIRPLGADLTRPPVRTQLVCPA
ncbi:UvrD/REP helicase (plasmid) [Deinococcus proteolyticus MRP]|uniref:DNA 3'-5' helicase n=1 Tax=Deinococcus proteolyticus (strain ATCC 35074 / DSM 20540 / JCM 6276 / NBRC 101906 / NCIMB 13154 / VKM Ac-1939 / CCM 2703 / MRP) TaxID=693977 RepID=F0RQG6_DEIPM|nr:UvrD-helicase domain-containing protein [Deinococcus proteolyticus]ADY27525.1 UvrD/REP helicase [Deinococcus proteolyticus MRP]